jgi:hypothetical protein
MLTPLLTGRGQPTLPQLSIGWMSLAVVPWRDRSRKCQSADFTVRGWLASTTLSKELWTSR